MLDFPLMLRVRLSDVYRIHPQSKTSAMGVENKATGESKVNDSPVKDLGVHKEFAQDNV